SEDGIVGDVLERRQSLVAQRQRAGLLEPRDAKLLHRVEHLLAADVERDLDRDGVDRMGERVVERHGVALAGGEVLRRPVAAGGAAAADDGVRRVFSRLERGEIDVRLERGAWLAIGM